MGVDKMGIDEMGVDEMGVNLPDKYTNHLLSCTHATKESSWFWSVVNFYLSLLSTYWVLSAYLLAVLEISICAY